MKIPLLVILSAALAIVFFSIQAPRPQASPDDCIRYVHDGGGTAIGCAARVKP